MVEKDYLYTKNNDNFYAVYRSESRLRKNLSEARYKGIFFTWNFKDNGGQ